MVPFRSSEPENRLLPAHSRSSQTDLNIPYLEKINTFSNIFAVILKPTEPYKPWLGRNLNKLADYYFEIQVISGMLNKISTGVSVFSFFCCHVLTINPRIPPTDQFIILRSLFALHEDGAVRVTRWRLNNSIRVLFSFFSIIHMFTLVPCTVSS